MVLWTIKKSGFSFKKAPLWQNRCSVCEAILTSTLSNCIKLCFAACCILVRNAHKHPVKSYNLFLQPPAYLYVMLTSTLSYRKTSHSLLAWLHPWRPCCRAALVAIQMPCLWGIAHGVRVCRPTSLRYPPDYTDALSVEHCTAYLYVMLTYTLSSRITHRTYQLGCIPEGPAAV